MGSSSDRVEMPGRACEGLASHGQVRETVRKAGRARAKGLGPDSPVWRGPRWAGPASSAHPGVPVRPRHSAARQL